MWYVGICKHRFCIYKVHTKSLDGEVSPYPSFFIVQNINRCRSPFQNLRFWKIASFEKMEHELFLFMISSLLQKNNFRRKPFMEKSNSKNFFRSAVKKIAEEDFWKIEIAETVTDNENENLSDPSANEIETLEDDETGELKETVEEEQTVMEDFETEDTSGHANFFYRQDGTSRKEQFINFKSGKFFKIARLLFFLGVFIFQNRKFWNGKRQRFEDFAELQNQGVWRFHHQAILYIVSIYKIYACDLLRRSVFSSPLFVYLKSKLKKNFLGVL